MAELKETFQEGLEIIFDTFEEAVKIGTYTLASSNDFDNSEPESCPIRCIFENHKEKDVSLLSFYDLIQPNDIIGIIPYDDVTLRMSNNGYCSFTNVDGIYSVEGHDTDPLNIIYTVLLRKN